MSKIDLDDPKLQPFLGLKDKVLKGQESCVAESETVVRKLLESKYRVKSILAHQDFFARHAQLIEKNNCECLIVDRAQLETIVGYNHHSGIMALVERPKAMDLGEINGPLVALNGVSGPENVGAIVRSAVAFGVTNFLIDGSSADPFIRRCIRVSMGNVFYANVAYCNDLGEAISVMNGHDWIAACAHGQTPVKDYQPKDKPFALVLGSEGHGIDPKVIESCAHRLNIQIDSKVSSLNVGHAGAVMLYELSK